MPPQTNDPQPLTPGQTGPGIPPEPTVVSPTPPSAPSAGLNSALGQQAVSPASVEVLPSPTQPPLLTGNGLGSATSVLPSQPGSVASSGVVVSNHDTSMQGKPVSLQAFGKPKRRFGMKLALIIVAAIVFLGGGSAAAYFGYYLPHEPQNELLMAVLNTTKQNQFSFSGNINVDSTNSGGVSVKSSFSGASDLSTKDIDIQTTTTVAGVTVPLEVRLVDQNLYIKFGDLSSLVSYISNFAGSDSSATQALTGVFDSVSQDLSNQWIEVDSTVLKQGGATCLLDTNLSLTNADLNLLKNQYEKNQFLTVNDTASDTVNGKAAEKYDISMNDDKLAAFLGGLNQLSASKALTSCEGSKTSSLSAHSLADGDNTPATVWVDKQTNDVVKISSQSTALDIQKQHEKASGSVTLTYGNVSITAPSGAKPYAEVLSEIEQSIATNPNTAPLLNLFSGGTRSGDTSLITQSL